MGVLEQAKTRNLPKVSEQPEKQSKGIRTVWEKGTEQKYRNSQRNRNKANVSEQSEKQEQSKSI